MNMRRVIVESPYHAETPEGVDLNVAYARACVRDSVLHGEAPIASHLLFTQPGILDDRKPDERAKGIAAGLAWRAVADLTVFYTDLGWSRGMREAFSLCVAEGRPYALRAIRGNVQLPPTREGKSIK